MLSKRKQCSNKKLKDSTQPAYRYPEELQDGTAKESDTNIEPGQIRQTQAISRSKKARGVSYIDAIDQNREI